MEWLSADSWLHLMLMSSSDRPLPAVSSCISRQRRRFPLSGRRRAATDMTCDMSDVAAALQRSGPSQKGQGLVLPVWVHQCTLWLCRIFHERYKASSSCHSPGDTVCACCRAFQCLPRLSFVADGLTVHLPHLNSEADVAGSVKQSSRTSSLRTAHEGPGRRDRASRLRATRLSDHLPLLSTAPSGLRRLSYSDEKGTGFFRLFQERKARRQAPVRVCQQIPVLYASFPSRERSSPNVRRQIVVEWFSIMGHLCQRP